MERKTQIISRGLPKTGQGVSYRTADDGQKQLGWWRGLTLAGNIKRFVQYTLSEDVVVLDRATGLMWPYDGNSEACGYGAQDVWNDAVDIAASLAFAGYQDWRLPNVQELISLLDFGTNTPAVNGIYFTNIKLGNHWTSSTRNSLTTSAWIVDFINGYVSAVAKTGTNYWRAVRGGLT